MKDDVLKAVRNNYNERRKEKEQLLKYKAELEKLKEDKNVKRYLELLKFDNIDIPTERNLIEDAYYSELEAFGKNNKNSNDIILRIARSKAAFFFFFIYYFLVLYSSSF